MPPYICLPWLATFSHSAFFSSTMSCLRHTLNLALSYCHTVVQCDLFCKQPLQHFHFQYLTLFFGAHHVNKPTNLGWKNSHYRSACMAARSHGGRTLVACGWLESPHTMLTGRLHFCQLWRWTWGAGTGWFFRISCRAFDQICQKNSSDPLLFGVPSGFFLKIHYKLLWRVISTHLIWAKVS